MCWRVWWSPGAIRWPVTDPGCGSRTRRRPTSPKRPRLGFRRSAKTLYPSLTGLLLNYRKYEKKSSLNFVEIIVYHHYHHHHDVRLARISRTLSLHVSLSFIAFGRSSGLHPVSSHSCCTNIRACRPAFDWPYAGVHRSTSLTISSLLLQQCPACLVRLACIVFVIGGRWPYSWRRVGCCCQDLFNIALNILV